MTTKNKIEVSAIILNALEAFDKSEDKLVVALCARWNQLAETGMAEQDAATSFLAELLVGTSKVWGKPQWKQIGLWAYRANFEWDLFHQGMRGAAKLLFPKETKDAKSLSSFSGKWMGLKKSEDLWNIQTSGKGKAKGGKARALNPDSIAKQIESLTAKLDGQNTHSKEWAEAKAAALLLAKVFA
jgi:hypothetical protein